MLVDCLNLTISIEDNETIINVNGYDAIFPMSDDITSHRDPGLHEFYKNSVKDLTLNPKDKVYFMPGCSVPRAKLKNVFGDLNIKITRNPEEADLVFISNNTINKMFDYRWQRGYKTKFIKKLIHLLNNIGYPLNKLGPKSINLDELDALLHDDQYEYITCNYLNILERDTDLKKAIINKIGEVNYESLIKHNKDSWTTVYNLRDLKYRDALLCFNKTMYDEKSLLKILNGTEAITIDSDTYDSLYDMFESGDNENHTIAMEIMANCNYDSSISYLLLLFNRYGNIMIDNKTRNHVNFKSLLNYIGSALNNNFYENSCFYILENTNNLTEEHVEILFKYFVDNHVSSDKLIQIKTFELSDDLQEKLGKNLIYNLKTKELEWTV